MGVIPYPVYREINNRDRCHIPILFTEKLKVEIRVLYPYPVHREINNRDGCHIPLHFMNKSIIEISVLFHYLFIEKS